jgi:hypothetical protein
VNKANYRHNKVTKTKKNRPFDAGTPVTLQLVQNILFHLKFQLSPLWARQAKLRKEFAS